MSSTFFHNFISDLRESWTVICIHCLTSQHKIWNDLKAIVWRHVFKNSTGKLSDNSTTWLRCSSFIYIYWNIFHPKIWKCILVQVYYVYNFILIWQTKDSKINVISIPSFVLHDTWYVWSLWSWENLLCWKL